MKLTAQLQSILLVVKIFTPVSNGENNIYLSLFYSGLDIRQYSSVKISVLLPPFQIFNKVLNSVVGHFLLPQIQNLGYQKDLEYSLDLLFNVNTKCQ